MSKDEELLILKRGVESTLDWLYANNSELIQLAASEQCLVGHFYRHFFGAIEALLQDGTLNVDLEYNKYGNEKDPKTGLSGRGWRPDMIVHHRGDQARNVCLFEFKRWNSRKSRRDADLAKVEEAVRSPKMKYHFACYVEFGKKRQLCQVKWVSRDSECQNC